MSSFNIVLDSSLYSKDSIFKCIYWYSKSFIIEVKLVDNYYNIEFTPKDSSVISVDKEFMDKLNQDFIDYNLRDIVSKETKNVRELIIAKAFSNGEYDEDPPGELNDPLGGTFV